MIRNSPLPSVTAVRTFSISAGLAASTVTPGSTAPDVSLTTPAMVPEVADCANAAFDRGAKRDDASTKNAIRFAVTIFLLWLVFSVRQRVGTQLELHGFAQGASAPLVVPRRVLAVVGPHSTALPTSLWIVDAAVHTSVIKPHWVRNGEFE